MGVWECGDRSVRWKCEEDIHTLCPLVPMYYLTVNLPTHYHLHGGQQAVDTWRAWDRGYSITTPHAPTPSYLTPHTPTLPSHSPSMHSHPSLASPPSPPLNPSHSHLTLHALHSHPLTSPPLMHTSHTYLQSRLGECLSLLQ